VSTEPKPIEDTPSDADMTAGAPEAAPAGGVTAADMASAEEPAVDEAVADEVDVPDEAYPDRPPLELIEEKEEEIEKKWYILKVQVNREDSIRDALLRRIKIAGYERYFGEVIVPTEDVAEISAKTGKRRIVKRKLYPGYLVVQMAINDDSWFLIRETGGIGDFTGTSGKPAPMPQAEIDKILKLAHPSEDASAQVKTSIPFKPHDRVRIKEGHFVNFEGEIESIDEANGRCKVLITIFGRPTPYDCNYWQLEAM
jgi:transcription termination/antitermination protein NusG